MLIQLLTTLFYCPNEPTNKDINGYLETLTPLGVISFCMAFFGHTMMI